MKWMDPTDKELDEVASQLWEDMASIEDDWT